MKNPPGDAQEHPTILQPRVKQTIRRTPRLTCEFHGTPAIKRYVVEVPLPYGGPARLLLDDYNQMMAAGWSNQWHLHSNGKNHAYVRMSREDMPGHIATAARLIVGGRRGTQVRYVDKNPCNLLPENLLVKDGYSLGREAEALAQADVETNGF